MLTAGWTLRANSSNTRCWYCISVPNLAAWNTRSPFHCSASISAGVAGKVAGAVPGRSHSVRKARSLVARTTSWTCSRQPVVLRVEDVVDRGQADVLVAAAVAGDVVRVEQLVVVGARRCRRRWRRRASASAEPFGAAEWAMSSRKAWPVRMAPAVLIGAPGLPSTSELSGITSRGSRSRRAGSCRRVGREQRHVGDVGVGQLDAEQHRAPAP